MTSVMLSPSAKLKTRDIVNKIKHGSPKLKEVLRQRCRERMREQREKFVNKHRKGLQSEYDDVQGTLSQILRKEFDNLSTTGQLYDLLEDAPVFDLDVELTMEEELFEEEEKWLLEEYEQMLFEEESYLTCTEDLTCPLCMKANVAKDPNSKDCISCKKCNFQLNTCYTMTEIGRRLRKSTEKHSSTCNGIPTFTLCEEDDKVCLYLICDKCSDIIPVE